MSEHKCSICNKEYRLKYNYDRHVILCEFLSKTRCEQNDELDATEEDIPSMLGLYKIIQSLSIRIDKLEKENAKLRNYSKKRIDILDWLNSSHTQPELCFEEWLNVQLSTKVTKHLDTVYNDNLLSGLKCVFDDIIESKSALLPIRCFDNKANVFYVYEKNGDKFKWVLLSTKDFDKQLNRVCNQFIIEFKQNWYMVNREKMERDETYKDMYINYYQKILGGDDKMTDEQRFQKLRQYLYQTMKENIKSVVEYDFV
jgi:hypothetical protein